MTQTTMRHMFLYLSVVDISPTVGQRLTVKSVVFLLSQVIPDTEHH